MANVNGFAIRSSSNKQERNKFNLTASVFYEHRYFPLSDNLSSLTDNPQRPPSRLQLCLKSMLCHWHSTRYIRPKRTSQWLPQICKSKDGKLCPVFSSLYCQFYFSVSISSNSFVSLSKSSEEAFCVFYVYMHNTDKFIYEGCVTEWSHH